ncbi:MAG: hypothetical protein Kow00105_12010 [Phycisphaeraceae bacterium]
MRNLIMRLKIHKFRDFACGLIISVCMLGLTGCSDTGSGSQQDATPAQPAQQSEDALIHTYTVRGRLVSLPDPSNPASELRIRHEAIDDFKDAEGNITPMRAMTMIFPPAPGLSLEEFSVNDTVEFVFEMQWKPRVEMRVTSIRKLPSDTILNFGSSNGQHHTNHAH